VTLTDTVQLQGGEFPGRYSMAVEETIHRGTLTVASWVLQPA
jgi:hypothetical protein